MEKKKINRFEDMEVWQLSRNLVSELYDVTGKGNFNRDIDLKRQIRRAAISILSNISEGFERKNNNEFIYFLNVAKGSAGELRAQLYIAFDLKYINESIFVNFNEKIVIISKSLSGFIKYLSLNKMVNKK